MISPWDVVPYFVIAVLALCLWVCSKVCYELGRLLEEERRREEECKRQGRL